ncbi:MAG: type I restriction enzyme HsdR N-terminal domain-containing protein [Elusimicrobia bacterium]|nr:type I restriction enzyme HsdR N-terminal domain-containing protein [Elusimicrobiota bacterium]
MQVYIKASGWGVLEDTKVSREYQITAGKIQTGDGRAKPLIADYILVYHGRKLAVIEAKSIELAVGEGVAQAKNYAQKLKLDFAFACNGKEIYQVCMNTGKEGLIAAFPSPEDLWTQTFATQNQWQDKFQV